MKQIDNSIIGKRIRIDNMAGEPQYAGREGEVTCIDDGGQIHGTWGGCALVPGVDDYSVIEGAPAAPTPHAPVPGGNPQEAAPAAPAPKPRYLNANQIPDFVRSCRVRPQGPSGRVPREAEQGVKA